MHDVNLYAIYSSDILGIIILLVAGFCSNLITNRTKRYDLRVFRLMYWINFFGCVTDMVIWTLEGEPGIMVRAILYIGNLYLFLHNIIETALLIGFLRYHLYGVSKNTKKVIRLFNTTSVIMSIFVTLTTINGWMFTIDRNNVYHRGPLSSFCIAYVFGCLLFCLLDYQHYKKLSGYVRFFPISVFLLPVTFGAIFQLSFYGTSLICPTLSVSLCGAVLSLQNETAYVDALTGILNRAGFVDDANRFLHSNKGGRATGVIIDIDDFKLINDFFGHEAGDKALQVLASNLSATFGIKNTVGRTGGDEFCVLIKDRSHEEAVSLIRELSDLEQKVRIGKEYYNFTISIGYAHCPEQAIGRVDLFTKADAALYNVKLHGKRGCQLYVEGMRKQERVALGFSLRDIATNIPAAIFVYEAEGDEKILYANDMLYQMFECDDIEDFLEFTNHSFKGIVHPDDLQKTEKSIWKQINNLEGEDSDYVEYRIRTKTGKVKNVIDYGHLVQNDRYGKIFYVIIADKEPGSLKL